MGLADQAGGFAVLAGSVTCDDGDDDVLPCGYEQRRVCSEALGRPGQPALGAELDWRGPPEQQQQQEQKHWYLQEVVTQCYRLLLTWIPHSAWAQQPEEQEAWSGPGLPGVDVPALR